MARAAVGEKVEKLRGAQMQKRGEAWLKSIKKYPDKRDDDPSTQ